MYNFSERTKGYLFKCGWSTSRNFDSTAFIDFLLENEYIPHESVINFLSSFGGLYILFERDGEPDDIEFNVIKADEYFFPYWVKSNYSERTNSVLCPIGVAYRDNMILSMNEFGHVYAGVDDILIRMGLSGEEAIENICSNNKDKFISIE